MDRREIRILPIYILLEALHFVSKPDLFKFPRFE